VDDEVGRGRVEGVVGPRQRVGDALPDVHPGVPLPARLDERPGRVDRGDVIGAQPLH